MDVFEKLKIFSDSTKYDVSCSSSGITRNNKNNSIGNTEASGICHTFTADGHCISLLKILLTNYCIYNCAYCINRASNDVERALFTPEEIAEFTINFYRRNYIEGIFLSSGVVKSSNHTMELLTNTISILRDKFNFNGYIHVKAIPGADESLIKKAGLYADRMSVNIELSSSESLSKLAPQKSKISILKPMGVLRNKIIETKDNSLYFKSTPKFTPAGQSTRMIIGATKDTDSKILSLSENLYTKFKLKRVYYSAFIPLNIDPKLPALLDPPLKREHRLYQADWLLRFHGFSANELFSNYNENLDMDFDPKTYWALNNMHLFPIEINKASFNTSIKIPGIGHKSAIKIVKNRSIINLNFDDLKSLGVVLKRAKYFITCNSKFTGFHSLDPEKIKNSLLFDDYNKKVFKGKNHINQMLIFDSY